MRSGTWMAIALALLGGCGGAEEARDNVVLNEALVIETEAVTDASPDSLVAVEADGAGNAATTGTDGAAANGQ